MRRRDFVALLSGVTLTPPLAAVAQQTISPVIGFLSGQSERAAQGNLIAFRGGLQKVGYSEGRNLGIQYRWSAGRYDQIPEMAKDLIARKVALIVAAASEVVALAAKAATSSTPIVFVNGGDPIEHGLVSNLNRPGGNITGVTYLINELGGKRLDILHKLVPGLSKVAVLINPQNADAESELGSVGIAATALGTEIIVLKASDDNEIDAAFVRLAELPVGALLIAPDAFFGTQSDKLVKLARHAAIPTIYAIREFAAAGGLMSYGTSFADVYALAGNYVGRILNGERPGDLPVQQSVRFELVINLKAAKVLNMTVPPSLLASADEVIE